MSKFKCSYRLVEKFAKMGSTSHAWIALHRCVEACASTKGQSFQATFEVLEAKFTFERKNNSLDIQTILRCASFLKEDRHSFLEKLNREIVIRKMEKKAGKRLSSNSAFLEICHAQNTYKKPKVGFWGWRRFRDSNLTIKQW